MPDSTMQTIEMIDRVSGDDPVLILLAIGVVSLVSALGLLWRYSLQRQARLDAYSDRTVEVITTYNGQQIHITKEIAEIKQSLDALKTHVLTQGR